MTSFAELCVGEVAEAIRISGIVQGVGFRPTVYRIAKSLGLRGEVSNDGEGVLIRVIGQKTTIEGLITKIQELCPPLARIDRIARRRDDNPPPATDFTIATSSNTAIRTQIAPDAATCPACRQEILDPASRWYRYPFTNCTHCGPRLSLIKRLPYDRGNTSMAAFPFCPECQTDYENPLNRRFHAQPTACSACGPQVWLETAAGEFINPTALGALDELDAVAILLQEGYIVAIKGLGGFHLACDATNEAVVTRLRQRKRRPDKPLALMVRDVGVIEPYCSMSEIESQILTSPAAPIVLLRKQGQKLAESIAPQQNHLGVMLPYTPLHALIWQRLDIPIVLTSGNLANDPQCIDNKEAQQKLTAVADYFLFHNRDIVNRVDDSVVRFVFAEPPTQPAVTPQPFATLQVLRRARGYAPAPMPLPFGFANAPAILAMGSELKNTFCLLREGQAIVSQHIGDLEKPLAQTAYRQTLKLYAALLDYHPQGIAIDLHPEYLSSKLGQEIAATHDLALYPVQHHHAHIAACMAENGLPLDTPPVLGIALDGLGYGTDETLWGGEFLLADYRRFERVATFKPVALLGGEQAVYQPWRNTYAHLQASELAATQELQAFFQQKPLDVLAQMLEQEINSPLASSCGRLFDAVAAAMGICRESCSYEGQAAIALETLAERASILDNKIGYPFALGKRPTDGLLYLESRPMWKALLRELDANIPLADIALKFHLGLADAMAYLVSLLRYTHGIRQVVLTGGVFQNQLLSTHLTARLQAMNLEVFSHSQVPANDGGLSLGQAAIAAALSLSRQS
jgi:hydrogenase maturation protein HypF